MINVKDANALESKIEDFILDRYKSNVYSKIDVNYSGVNYNKGENILTVMLNADIRRLDKRKEVRTEDDVSIDFKFEKDYRMANPNTFHSLMNSTRIETKTGGNYISFNTSGGYFSLLYDFIKLFHSDIHQNNKELVYNSIERVFERLDIMEGVALKTSVGYKVMFTNFMRGNREELYVFDTVTGGYVVTLYTTQNRKISLTLKGDKLKIEKGEYKRFPDNARRIIEIMLMRHAGGEDIANGDILKNIGYQRALHKLKSEGVD